MLTPVQRWFTDKTSVGLINQPSIALHELMLLTECPHCDQALHRNFISACCTRASGRPVTTILCSKMIDKKRLTGCTLSQLCPQPVDESVSGLGSSSPIKLLRHASYLEGQPAGKGGWCFSSE